MKSFFSILIFFIFAINAYGRQVYVFGESHTFPFKQIPGCVVKHLGAVTMHRIGRDGFNIHDLSDFETRPQAPVLRDNDAVVFVTGVVDNYMHIYKQKYLLNRDLDEIIRTLVLKYVHSVYFSLLQYPKVIKIIYNIIPPIDSKSTNLWGTKEEHIYSAKKINEMLRTICPVFGIEFLDVYDLYADQNGLLRYELSDGDSHIGNYCGQGIQQKLFEILNKYGVEDTFSKWD